MEERHIVFSCAHQVRMPTTRRVYEFMRDVIMKKYTNMYFTNRFLNIKLF